MKRTSTRKYKQENVLNYADDEFVKTFFWCKEIIPLLFKDHSNEYLIDENNRLFWEQFCEQVAYLLKVDAFRFRFIPNSTAWTEKYLTPSDLICLSSFQPLEKDKNDLYQIQIDKIIGKTYKINGENNVWFSFNYFKEKAVEIQLISKSEIENDQINNVLLLIEKILNYISQFFESKSFENKETEANVDNVNNSTELNKIYTADDFMKEIVNKMLYELRLRLYNYLRSEYIENFAFDDPMCIFFLQAFYEDNNDIPSFGYIFDIKQLSYLKNAIKMPEPELEFLQSRNMMKPGEGICGKVAKEKSFVFAIEWKKATNNVISEQVTPASEMTIKAEERFIGKYPHLYEWPILEKNKVRFVLCLAYSGKNLLTHSVILNLQQIFYKEFINIIFFVNSSDYFVNQLRFLSSEVSLLRSSYSHFFSTRFIHPVNILLRNLKKKLIDNESIDLIKVIQVRLGLFISSIQAISFGFNEEIEKNKGICNVSEILKNEVTNIFNYEKEWIAEITAKNQYTQIKLDNNSIEGELKVYANKDSLEKAFLAILLNTLELDVFSLNRVMQNAEKCLVKIEAKSEQIDDHIWIVVEISNNGEPINKNIKDRLDQMFANYKNLGLQKIKEYQIKNITGRKTGEHTGIGLLYAATVFSSIEIEGDNEKRGYIEIDSTNELTSFKVFLPLFK